MLTHEMLGQIEILREQGVIYKKISKSFNISASEANYNYNYNEDDADLEEEDLACYRYTDDYQDHQLELTPSNGCEIKGGQLIDLSDFLLSKINILDIDDIDI